MPRTAQHKAQTRRKILDETVRTLRLRGVHAVRIHQIMHEVGLTHGGFYAHFASREALLAEAASEMSGASDALMRLQQHPGPPAAALAGFLDHYLSLAHCERAHGSCALPILLPDANDLPRGGRASALRLAARLTRALAQRLEALGQAAPQDMARRMLAEVIGLITLARAQSTCAARSRLLAQAREDLTRAYGLLPVVLPAASSVEPGGLKRDDAALSNVEPEARAPGPPVLAARKQGRLAMGARRHDS